MNIRYDGPQAYYLCHHCDQRIIGTPVTRSFGDEVQMFCSPVCRNDHIYEAQREAAQATFAFDVVGEG